MEFTKSLIKGKLIKRYKRFFTDVKLDKEIVTAHCPNTGSMKGLLDEGNEVYILPNNDPKRKLKYGLEIIKTRKNLVGVNTHIANRIAQHGLENNLMKELKNNNFPGFYVGQELIKVDQKFFRPAETNNLLGNSLKARKILKWKPKTTIE